MALIEYLASKISKVLLEETGFEVTFESAIVPVWKDGTIRMKNVTVVCNQETWTDLKKQEYLALLADSKEHSTLPPTFNPKDVDVNFTYWDLKIQSVDITLSLLRWFESKGFLKECTLQGVRGNVDRRHLWWDSDWKPTRRPYTRSSQYEIEKFNIHDLLVTISNSNFRPFTFSIFHAEFPRLRRHWLLYDFLSADSVV